MDCKRVEAELVGFQLAALDGATRVGVETHLVTCGRCVGQFLALKRAVDAGEDVGPGPSEISRQRILRAAGTRAAELAKQATPVGGNVVAEASRERRLAQRWFMATAAVVLGAAAPLAWHATHATTTSPSVPVQMQMQISPRAPVETLGPDEVDSARLTPANLRFL